jgi:endogenous inhibitor of DNA gyrase (YacG/DUF329 family)
MGAGNGKGMADEHRTVRCPGCGTELRLAEARERADADEQAPLTCPTCGAGFDRDENVVHEPAIGP